MVEIIIIKSAQDHSGDVVASKKGKCFRFSSIHMGIMITLKSSSFYDLIIGFGVKHNTQHIA